VDRVVCACDCGVVVNPDTVEAQLQGAIVFGVTAALYGEITLENGCVEQGNFDDYRMLRIDQAPVIEIDLAPSREVPGGIGEPGTAPSRPRCSTRCMPPRACACASCRSSPRC
jgi:isoquinoline 1-oxidoreductase subunit beta